MISKSKKNVPGLCQIAGMLVNAREFCQMPELYQFSENLSPMVCFSVFEFYEYNRKLAFKTLMIKYLYMTTV